MQISIRHVFVYYAFINYINTLREMDLWFLSSRDERDRSDSFLSFSGPSRVPFGSWNRNFVWFINRSRELSLWSYSFRFGRDREYVSLIERTFLLFDDLFYDHYQGFDNGHKIVWPKAWHTLKLNLVDIFAILIKRTDASSIYTRNYW